MILNPLAGVITSPYNLTRRHPLLLVKVPHYGTDIGGRPRGGTHPIHAPAAGRVVATYDTYKRDSRAERKRRRYLPRLTGQYVVLDHGRINGRSFRTYCGHLDKVTVEPGQRVKAGQKIGTQGATGEVAGAHLHLEVWIAGQTVDPAEFFATHGVRLGTDPTTPPQEEDIMAKLDDDDYDEIAQRVWAYRTASADRTTWQTLNRTNHAVGRIEDAVRGIVDRIATAVWTWREADSRRTAHDIIDRTNHAAGRLETGQRDQEAPR